MYIFVRFTAIVAIILGVLLMLFGIVGSIYGFFQNDAFTALANDWLKSNDDMRRVINAGYALLVLGAAGFIVGMVISAVGQLLLIFVDLANHARETNLILRSLRANPALAKPQKNRRPADEEIPDFYE